MADIFYMSKGDDCCSQKWGWTRRAKDLVESPACQDVAFLLGVQITIKAMELREFFIKNIKEIVV